MALSPAAQEGRRGSRLPGRLLSAALASVAAYYAVWGGEYSAFDLLRLREQAAAEEARLSEVRSEADSLRLLAGRLETDPATIERVARERFGMIRDDEVLYRFVEVAQASPRQTASLTP